MEDLKREAASLTDALIRAGFKAYIPETTKIIIAQRVASVQDADLILVMNNGIFYYGNFQVYTNTDCTVKLMYVSLTQFNNYQHSFQFLVW